MAAPNIVNVTTITGKTAGLAVTTSAAAIITGGANKVTKVNALYISNVDGVSNADVSVTFYDFGTTTSFHIAKTVTVPADSTIDVLTKAIYLEEGDELRLAANANSDIEAVASFEEIS
jgi:beta-lactamase class A